MSARQTAISQANCQPCGLWSLWDMLMAYGFLFVHSMEQIDEVCAVAESDPTGTWKSNITTGSMAGPVFDTLLNTASHLAKETGMRSVTDQVSRLRQMIDILDLPLSRIAPECVQLRVRLREELTRKDFLFVSEEMTKLYNESDPRRGAARTDPFELGDKFEKAHEDIAGATRCLAVGEGTACVMHLARAMDAVLGKLATRLQIKIGGKDSWGVILNAMSTKINNMPQGTKRQKDKRDKWSEARVHLFHVKEAWRDRPMHAKESFSQERAKEIYEATRVFINHFAGL
jgi:hypothetical protein